MEQTKIAITDIENNFDLTDEEKDMAKQLFGVLNRCTNVKYEVNEHIDDKSGNKQFVVSISSNQKY